MSAAAPPSPSPKFIWFDFIRGFSALAVCASHLRAAMFVDYPQLESPGIADKLFYFATGLGHQAVVVFFVLSGFFVGGSVLRAGAGFQPGAYAAARLSRLWIVLVPALVLTALIDQLIKAVAPGVLSGAFEPVWNSGPVSSSEYSTSFFNFIANVFFLQTIRTPVFGTNGPLWSLANEFWYYVLFPLGAMALAWVGDARRMQRIVLGAVALLILVLLPIKIVAAFPIWLLGLTIYFSVGKLGTTARRTAVLAGAVALGAALAYSRSGSLQLRLGIPYEALIGLAICLLCVGLANLPAPRNARSLFVRGSQAVSNFSYSLYLVHFPVVALIGATLYGKDQVAPTAAGLAQFAGWMVLLAAIGAVFWWLFERHTDVLRRALSPRRRPVIAARQHGDSRLSEL